MQIEKILSPKRVLTPEDDRELSDFKKRVRRCERTFKGIQQVIKRLPKRPKGLKALDSDRVKQATEEVRRVKGELIQVITVVDTMLLRGAGEIEIGQSK